MRTSYVFVLLPALIGAALGAFAYSAPNTGADGTPGALLALIGAAAATLGAFLAMIPSTSGWRLSVLNLLLGLSTVLTATAAYFLMQYAFALVMALAFLGLILVILNRSNRRVA